MGGVVIFDAVAGVEPQSETVWRQADRYHVPRICFVNKMDRIGADFERCVQMMVDRLGTTPLVLQLPLGSEAHYTGIVDLIEMKAVVWKDETLGAEFADAEIPDDLADQAARYREALIETAVEHDEAALEAYQRYTFDAWPSGVYSTANLTGSRSGGGLASAWAVAHYLGVPPEDRTRFDGWTEQIVAAAAQGNIGATEGIADLLAYFSELIERRRSDPGDDMVSHLVQLGEEDVSLLWVLGFAFTMVTGGNDTATGLLGGSAVLLTEHRDERRRLLEDPGLLPGAVEELLRLTSPVQGLARTATRDVDVGGTVIPAGDKVLLGYGAANRDEREFGPTPRPSTSDATSPGT